MSPHQEHRPCIPTAHPGHTFHPSVAGRSLACKSCFCLANSYASCKTWPRASLLEAPLSPQGKASSPYSPDTCDLTAPSRVCAGLFHQPWAPPLRWPRVLHMPAFDLRLSPARVSMWRGQLLSAVTKKKQPLKLHFQEHRPAKIEDSWWAYFRQSQALAVPRGDTNPPPCLLWGG